MNRSSKKKIGKVKVKCGWPSGWVIDDPELGKRRIKDGETVEFDPTDGVQLHNLIQVLRVVNSPRRNITEHKSPDDKRLHIQKRKFEIVEGLEYLPKALQETKMSYMEYTPAERNAILSLVPDFPSFKRKERHTIQVIK